MDPPDTTTGWLWAGLTVGTPDRPELEPDGVVAGPGDDPVDGEELLPEAVAGAAPGSW